MGKFGRGGSPITGSRGTRRRGNGGEDDQAGGALATGGRAITLGMGGVSSDPERSRGSSTLWSNIGDGGREGGDTGVG